MCIKYIMNIPIASTHSTPCTHVTIQSTGDSTLVEYGFYERKIFGTYSFVSIDERGNNIYHAHIQNTDWFLTKTVEGWWVVSITILYLFTYMM